MVNLNLIFERVQCGVNRKKKKTARAGCAFSQAVKSRITKNQRKDEKEASSFCAVDGLSGFFLGRGRSMSSAGRRGGGGGGLRNVPEC